jgi:hypothetical protein
VYTVSRVEVWGLCAGVVWFRSTTSRAIPRSARRRAGVHWRTVHLCRLDFHYSQQPLYTALLPLYHFIGWDICTWICHWPLDGAGDENALAGIDHTNVQPTPSLASTHTPRDSLLHRFFRHFMSFPVVCV